MPKRRCPTPTKRAYGTKAEADKHVSGLYAKEGRAALVHSYMCTCGFWHVGGRRKVLGRKRKRY